MIEVAGLAVFGVADRLVGEAGVEAGGQAVREEGGAVRVQVGEAVAEVSIRPARDGNAQKAEGGEAEGVGVEPGAEGALHRRSQLAVEGLGEAEHGR